MVSGTFVGMNDLRGDSCYQKNIVDALADN